MFLIGWAKQHFLFTNMSRNITQTQSVARKKIHDNRSIVIVSFPSCFNFLKLFLLKSKTLQVSSLPAVSHTLVKKIVLDFVFLKLRV